MKRLLGFVLALLLAFPSVAAAGPRTTARDWTNALRERRERPALTMGRAITRHAQAHAVRIRDASALFHSSPAEMATYCPRGWTMAGENVGVGTSVLDVMLAFRASPPHRRNLLRPEFTRLGVGIARADGDRLVWVVLVFCAV